MDKLKLMFILVLILSSIVLVSIVYKNILEPAYISYASTCKNLNTEDYGYYQAGTTTKEGNETVVRINTAYPEEIQKIVKKHEYIHVAQHDRLEITCNNLFLLELEAYTFQNLPDKIYSFFYL